ncbi:uncharacterized protein LOC141848882 [Brevipalpus obovatus]|uniref:uncharacterized protein LOC141848882 n=1 Tax=Brevipalpus obovatus TaxID=246614 RepID=UPI003D9DDC35
MKIYHRCRRRIEQKSISIDSRIKYFGIQSLWALIIRNHFIFIVTFFQLKILLFALMCTTVITFPSVLATSSSNIQSSSNSPGSHSPREGINHLEDEPEDEPIELFVSLRQLQSYHHQPQSKPNSRSSTHQSSIRMAWNEEDGDVQMDEPDNGPMFESDDLIYSGSGCFDDEDKCSGFAETDPSDDDLITPVYTPPKTSSPVTMTPNTTNTNITEEPDEDDDEETDDGGGGGDDDEDEGGGDDDDDDECTTDEENCVEGSGSEEPISTQLPPNAFSTSTTQFSTDLNPVTKPSYHHHTTESPTTYHKPPSFSIPSPVWPVTTESSIDQPFLPSDPTIYEDLGTPPPWQERPRPRPTQPWSTSPKPPVTRPTHTNPINLPRPPRVEPEEPVEKPKNLLIPAPANNSATDSMATIIGFVGIVLISTVITIPLFLFLRVRNQSRQRYKQATGRQEPKTLGFLPVSGTPPLLSSASHQTQLNSALITQTNGKSSKTSKKKDSREWYV